MIKAITFCQNSSHELSQHESVKAAKEFYKTNALRLNKSVFVPPIGYIKLLNETKKRGGSRPGAGAPTKPKTKAIPFRLRLDEIDHIKQVVKEEVAKLRKGKPKPPPNDYA